MAGLRKLVPTFTIVALLSAVIALYVAYTGTQRQYATQQVCDRSHSVISGRLEEACTIAQESNDTEYLCNSYRPDAFCWVELK